MGRRSSLVSLYDDCNEGGTGEWKSVERKERNGSDFQMPVRSAQRKRNENKKKHFPNACVCNGKERNSSFTEKGGGGWEVGKKLETGGWRWSRLSLCFLLLASCFLDTTWGGGKASCVPSSVVVF
mmetsp:Transcript_30424/g.78738  ORF Transcript_30424/g.78738 Transcript_30424/m.78738 type:complete len:125 (-) Transcript_30424:4921-5295(-)